MKQEGVFPYDYMDSLERSEEKQLPTKDDFYSIFNSEHKSDKQYKRVNKIKYRIYSNYKKYVSIPWFIFKIWRPFNRWCFWKFQEGLNGIL